MSRAGGESRESGSLLVRIAEKPLVVAALFIFTALFPWLLYFLVPILSRASILDLLQWLSLPVLFLVVNGVLIFQWLNHGKGPSGSISHGDPADWYGTGLHKQPSIEVVLPKEEAQEHETESKLSSSATSSFSSDTEPETEPEPEPEPEVDKHTSVKKVQIQEQRPYTVEVHPPRTTVRHRKTESLNLNLQIPDLMDPPPPPAPEAEKSSMTKPPKVTRRNSSPKSKTPQPRSFGLADESHHQVTRRNSSPKSMPPTPNSAAMKFETERSTTIHEGSYKSPLRSIREPIPLDQDDLNDRIDKFLTNFKIKRQESNLRAALTSIGQ